MFFFLQQHAVPIFRGKAAKDAHGSVLVQLPLQCATANKEVLPSLRKSGTPCTTVDPHFSETAYHKRETKETCIQEPLAALYSGHTYPLAQQALLCKAYFLLSTQQKWASSDGVL